MSELLPIKAKEPGKGGRKHTVAPARLNDAGKVEIHLLCSKSGCNCGGWYVLEDLLESFTQLVREGLKEKAA